MKRCHEDGRVELPVREWEVLAVRLDDLAFPEVASRLSKLGYLAGGDFALAGGYVNGHGGHPGFKQMNGVLSVPASEVQDEHPGREGSNEFHGLGPQPVAGPVEILGYLVIKPLNILLQVRVPALNIRH